MTEINPFVLAPEMVDFTARADAVMEAAKREAGISLGPVALTAWQEEAEAEQGTAIKPE